MTVIAWDGKVMASDTCGYAENIRSHTNRKKLHRVKINGVQAFIGGAGSASQVQKVVQWAKKGADMDNFPAGLTNCIVLLVKNGTGFLLDGDSLADEIKPPFAIGAGAEMALGAMLGGADACKAVDICIKKHIYCGGIVDFVLCEPEALDSCEWEMMKERICG